KTNGLDAMQIDSLGDVEVGTTTVTDHQKLTVAQSNTTTGVVKYALYARDSTNAASADTNIAGYFNAISGLKNWAIVTPVDGGIVGLNLPASNPRFRLDVYGSINSDT